MKLYGLDTEAGWHVTPNFNLYASAAFTHSALQDNYAVVTNKVAAYLPVKGKELVLTPDQTYSARAQYKIGDLSLALEGKYQSKRYVSDMNDAFLKANTVANFDAQYQLPTLGKGSVLQLNVMNIFNSKYNTRSTTVTNVNSATLSNGATYTGAPYYLYTAAPIEAMVALKTKW